MTDAMPDIHTIFCEALDRTSPVELARYLDEACGSDSALRTQVEELLSSHRAAGQFLGGLAAGGDVTVVPSVSEAPGTQIGPYKLLEQIGEGAFGIVYMAEQSTPVRRKVALKILKPGMDTRQVIARFEVERQALALMDHPNIAKVFDAGATQAGRPYFVMELVRGIPITEHCDQNNLPVPERLELFITVCRALQHAHQKGIIHRDIKPSNVLVSLQDDKPTVKVIDFGVAKATSGQLTDKTLCTGFAQTIGTPLYMSPEAAFGGFDLDTRSDIYSLGVLLYELLTGTTPFDRQRLKEAAYVEILRIIREEDPPRPSTRLSDLGKNGRRAATDRLVPRGEAVRATSSSRHLANGTRSAPAAVHSSLASISAVRKTEPHRLSHLLRGELDWIVMKALEKDRTRRYATALGLASDVEHYLADEPVEACPPSAWYRLSKLMRRHKGEVFAASLLALALVVGIIGTTWGMLRATDEANLKERALKDREAALDAAQKSKRDANEKLFESYFAQARANRLSRRAGQRIETLEILQQVTDLARTLELPDKKFHELRNAVIGSLSLPDMHLTGPRHPWPANAYAVDFDEAHSLYVRTDRAGNCSVRRFADDSEIQHLRGLGGAPCPFLSRDGRFLAIVQCTEDEKMALAVQLWDLERVPAREISFEKNARWVDFHPNGQQVAVVYNDGAIGLFELPGGRRLSRLTPHPILTQEVTIALHPSESLVAVCSYFGSVVQLRDLITGEVLASLPQSTHANSVAWHPDGRILAVGLAEAHQIHLYDRTTLQAFQTLELENNASTVTFNHAGDRLVSDGWGRSGAELVDIGTGRKLFTTSTAPRGFHFSPDDRRLAGTIEDGRLGIWQLADGREYRMLLRRRTPKIRGCHSLSVSPDGRLIAAGMADGFGLWDLASGSELAFIPTGGANNFALFEPSGDLLVMCPSGLLRWRIGKDSPEQWVIGPPERLPLPRGHGLGQSRDGRGLPPRPHGRVIVTCNRFTERGGWILHADRQGQPICIDAGAEIGFIAVSPDGRWVVTVTHNPDGQARVWDAHDGQLIKELAKWGSGYPQFSPDGKWLSTELDGGRLFAVRDWEPGPQVGGAGTFAPDSKLLAVVAPGGAIRLVDPGTGRELAMLEDQDQDVTGLPIFTPDGTRLIAFSWGKVDGIRVRDLRLIRQHLATMGLDWDAPPYPPADPVSEVVPLILNVRLE
jgi:serine/threonine protein kinase/WD40 repeat protein